MRSSLSTVSNKLSYKLSFILIFPETTPTRRRNSLSSLPLNDSEAERSRSPFPPSPVPLGHGRSLSSSSLHEKSSGLPNGKIEDCILQYFSRFSYFSESLKFPYWHSLENYQDRIPTPPALCTSPLKGS